VRWKAELPGRGLSNPVIAGGRVYLTASSGHRDRRLHVLCFDLAGGKKLWERRFVATGSTNCNPKTCMAAPTPATDGAAVYALFATGDLAALDSGGDLLWYRSLVGDYPKVTNQVGMAASPALAGNVLLVPLENAGDSLALGLDTRTGKNLWKARRFRDINWVSPVVFPCGGRPAALFGTRTDVTAYDPETGKVRWTFRADDLSSIPSPAYGGGLVFVPGAELRALRLRGGKPEVVWKTPRLRHGYGSPVYHKGRLYGLGGVTVDCVNARDGEPLWQQRVTGPFAASPVIGDGKLYAVNERGMTTVIQLGDRPKVLARNELNETILATPALADGAIFLRSDKHLWCIGAKKK
jgi:outer membrane protein assembly factor BamB